MTEKTRFTLFYQDSIQKQIEELNKIRKKVAPLAIAAVIGSIIVPGYGFFWVVDSNNFKNIAWIGVILIIVFGMSTIVMPFVSWGLVTAKYREKYKESVISKALSKISSKCEYRHMEGIPEDFFNSSMLYGYFPEPSGYFSEDLFVLERDKNSVAFSEVEAQCGSSKTRRTFFHGLVGFIPVGTDFMEPIVVRSRELEKYSGGGAILTMTFESWNRKIAKLKNIDFNDPAFDSQFKVYTAKLKKAVELFTPDIRSGLLKIKQKIGSEFHFSLVNGLLYITIPIPRNIFDPPVLSELDKGLIKQEFTLIESMLNLIDLLNIRVEDKYKRSSEEVLTLLDSFKPKVDQTED